VGNDYYPHHRLWIEYFNGNVVVYDSQEKITVRGESKEEALLKLIAEESNTPITELVDDLDVDEEDVADASDDHRAGGLRK